MNKIFKAGVTVGLMAGFFFLLLFITLFALDTSLTSSMYNVDLGLMAFFIFITLIYFRDYLNFQEMKVTEGLLSGAIATLVSALFVVSSVYILMTFISPESLPNDIQQSIDGLMNKNEEGVYYYVTEYGQEAFDEQLKAFETFTVSQLVTLKFILLSLVGFAFTLVFSIFLRNQYDTEA